MVQTVHGCMTLTPNTLTLMLLMHPIPATIIYHEALECEHFQLSRHELVVPADK